MHEDFEYVESLEKEIDELESEKADFSNIYDLLLEECVSKDLSKQTESVNKEVHNNLLKSFSKLEKHSISLELALQQCKEQMKNNSVCKENGSNVFRKEREQYHEIQDLKAQMQDKNIAISELKKLIEKCKGKSVETQFDKPSVVRQPNAQRIPKPSVLGKPTPFSNSPEMRKYLSRLNPRASAQNKDAKSSSKTNKEIMPVEKSVHLRTRKDRIFTGIGWVPIVKLLKLLPGKVENEPTLVQMRYLQSYFLHAKNLEFSARIGIQDHSNEQSSSKLVPKLFLKQQGQLHHGKSGLLLHLHIAMM
ncbi:hypothetical protein Tco_0970561 [Tanacetum coccineum]